MVTKQQIFERYFNEYVSPKTSKKRKNAILDAVCDVTQLHRKTVIRRFHRIQFEIAGPTKRRGPKTYYTPDAVSALRTVWECSSELCGELLHPAIPDYVASLKRDQQWKPMRGATKKLLLMSEATVKRKIAGFVKARHSRKGMSATRPSHIKTLIPIFTGPWDGKPCGYGQIDTVVHCGATLCGDMVYSVNYTDVATLWVVLCAQWNKSQSATRDSLERMRKKAPFPLKGVHPDSGSEFVNYHVKAWADEHGIELTRSRPNHKNDNAYVEQRNGHVIRRFLHYDRFDYEPVVKEMNAFYDNLELYVNHFLPTRKCIEKVRVGAKYRRRYDKARAPYQRVLDAEDVDEGLKEKLKKIHERLNPMDLMERVERSLRRIRRKQATGSKIMASKLA